MTTYDLAVAVCGATRPCSGEYHRTPYLDPQTDGGCPDCNNTDFVYVLGERARKPCDCGWCDTVEGHNRGCSSCQGLDWLPTILLPEEPCHCWHVIDRNEGRSGTIRKAPVVDCRECGGSGTIRRVDEGLLITLLEEAGFVATRRHEYDNLDSPTYWRVRKGALNRTGSNGDTLLEAAAKALQVWPGAR